MTDYRGPMGIFEDYGGCQQERGSAMTKQPTDALLEKLIAAVLKHADVHVESGELRMHKNAVKADMIDAMQAAAPTPNGEGVAKRSAEFQSGVDAWMDACFNAEIKADVQERCDRFIEEALEFVQATGYSARRAHALVDYTFGRPQGEVNQEVGGVAVTLAAACNTLGIDIGVAANAELARVWTKIDAIRAKQAVKPTGSALPVAATPINSEGLESTELVKAADGLDHVAAALNEVHALSGVGDPAFDASMFGQIAAVERGSSLLRRAALEAVRAGDGRKVGAKP